MKAKVLLVDDEDHILETFRREFRNHYNMSFASSAWEALAIIEDQGPFAVVVSDWKMPGTDGVAFLGEVMKRAPETTRIMLTGVASGQLAVDAVNRGYLFRFHSKPCPLPELQVSIEDGIALYREQQQASGAAVA